MKNIPQVGQIDETGPLVSVPSLPIEEEASPVGIVLPYPVGGVPAGTPIGSDPGPVTL